MEPHERQFGAAVGGIESVGASESIAPGAGEAGRLLGIYNGCKKTDTWPGYSEEPITLDLPAWAWKQVDQREGQP